MYSGITDIQRRLLDGWLGTWQIVDDYSWPLQDTTVLHVRTADEDCIVKASAASHHIPREIAAHHVLRDLPGTAPTLLHESAADFLLVTRYQPGEIVEGAPAEWSADTYRQAGALLNRLLVPGDPSSDYSERLRRQCTFDLDNAVGLVATEHLNSLRDQLDSVVVQPVPVCFTHGDYHPRNWLIDEGQVSVIDFGRAEQRHWTSDLFRLHNQQFVDRPDFEEAFLEGLGRTLDESDRDVWKLEQIHQSLSTVVWANGIGDTHFEDAGRAMVARIA
ncbi:aminoglycoside phosphotransferase family protein [Rhodococcus sp. NPDC058521]|uniref:aminoglycoside phosphotransferase family protein n=1 Tax=Rhodococcus sp. NPDC058521 TaxID=3346536 RepID=UPI0036595378